MFSRGAWAILSGDFRKNKTLLRKPNFPQNLRRRKDGESYLRLFCCHMSHVVTHSVSVVTQHRHLLRHSRLSLEGLCSPCHSLAPTMPKAKEWNSGDICQTCQFWSNDAFFFSYRLLSSLWHMKPLLWSKHNCYFIYINYLLTFDLEFYRSTRGCWHCIWESIQQLFHLLALEAIERRQISCTSSFACSPSAASHSWGTQVNHWICSCSSRAGGPWNADLQQYFGQHEKSSKIKLWLW